MGTRNAIFGYQEILLLDGLAKSAPHASRWEILVDGIEKIVDTTKDKTTFVFGLRVLSEHGFKPETLDAKIKKYNETRAAPNYLVENYQLVDPEGNIIRRDITPNITQ